MTQLSRRHVMAGLAACAAPALAVKLPRPVRVAVVGVEGHLAEIVDPLPHLPDVTIVAAAHQRPELARKRFPKATIYSDYRKMLDEAQPDVVAVCNTNGERAEAVLECARRGVHIIAEKPLALTLAEYERVARAVGQSKGKITTLFPLRFEPAFLALKQIVDSGEIGEVVQMDAQKSYRAPDAADWKLEPKAFGSTIPWIGIHMVDLMRYCSGRELVETYSTHSVLDFGFTKRIESVTASVFKLDNRGAALLRMDYFRPPTAPTHGDDRLRLVGSKGIAEYMAATGVTLLRRAQPPAVISELPAPRELFAEFLDHVYNGRPEPITWSDIDRANRIVLHTWESAQSGKPVRC